MRSRVLVGILLAMLLVCSGVRAEVAYPLRVVPTFQCISVYYDSEAAPATVAVEYRADSETTWTRGLGLNRSDNDPILRGSLVDLQEGTLYHIRCVNVADREVLAEAVVQTWSSSPPVGREVSLADLAPDGGPVLIELQGTPDAWVRVTAPEGWVVDGGEQDEEAILIDNSSYVIVEGLKVIGGRRHGFRVRNSYEVRIANCDISGYGRLGKQDISKDGKYYTAEGRAINWDAGVYLLQSRAVTVERCYVHDPRNHANPWRYSHPAGPNAVFVDHVQNIVVRYNDFVGSNRHRWNDAIEGWGNGRADGGFCRDSDIHGNFFAFGNDDGIELDGRQCNIRFFENKVEGFLCGISTAPNLFGPSYVYRNLVVHLGDEDGAVGSMMKQGGGSTHSRGLNYLFHNTFFGPGSGNKGVGFGQDKDRTRFLGMSRNNVFYCGGLGLYDTAGDPRCDFDYDLFWRQGGTSHERAFVTRPGQQANALVADPQFADAALADFRPAPESPAIDAGAPVPGFDAHVQGRPDLGAFEQGVDRPLPYRPHGLRADRYEIQLDLDATAAPAAAPVTIRLREDAPPVAWSVVKNRTADWFSVAPASGILQPGQSARLAVAAQQKLNVRPGLHPAAFLVRTTGGYSLPVTVYGRLHDRSVVQYREAETPDEENPFEIFADVAASGGHAVRLQPVEERVLGERCLTFAFDLPEARQDLRMCLRMRAELPLGSHDSCFLSVNDGKPFMAPLAASTVWAWVQPRGAAGLSLRQGRNLIRIFPRETIDLDRILLTTDPLPPEDE